jgi:hypothetical protein
MDSAFILYLIDAVMAKSKVAPTCLDVLNALASLAKLAGSRGKALRGTVGER